MIMKDWLKPGTHLSCIGSDMEGKEEIDPTRDLVSEYIQMTRLSVSE